MDKTSPQIERKKVLLPTKIQLTQIFHALGIVAFYSGLYLIFFSPVLFSGRLLAPGDGIFCYLPNFSMGNMLWDTMLFSGYPLASDPQTMNWYPLSWIFSSIGSWNGFVLSAYVLGSSFVYGYVYTLTQSRLAGMVSGIIYGMSGFMIIHLGHTTIIHTAAWMPLMLWAIEKQRFDFSPLWFVATCVAVTLSALSGHPQILVYALGLCTVYASFLGWFLGAGRWKFYGLYLMAVIIGLALASILLIPASELISQTPRSSKDFTQFVSYSLPPYQTIKLLFPFLFGSLQESFYGLPYFGLWILAELTGYVGLLSLLLSAIGTTIYRKNSTTWFWLGIGVLVFLLALGGFTPLAKIMYHVPLFNKFRAPARHLLEVTLAVSVLSGIGINAIQKQLASKKTILRTLLVGLGIMLMGLTSILFFSTQLKAFAAEQGIEKIEFLPWSNPAVGFPLVIFLLASVTLFFWSRQSQSRFRQLVLLSVLIIDLGSFGWFVDWKYHSPEKSILTAPDSAQRYKSLIQNTSQRMVPIRGVMGSTDEIPPNLSKLWGVPNASGYATLILSRIIELLSMSPSGGVTGAWSSPHNRSLDVMAIRYVFLPKHDTIPIPVKDPNGISWSKDDLTLSLGSGCGLSRPSSVNINLPIPVRATSIGIVSSLSCSTAIPDETKIVNILATDINEKVYSVKVLAGRDTSEWAFDCHDVLPLMKHRKAQVFRSFPVVRGARQEEGHHYVAKLPLEKELEIKHLELQWVGPSAVIAIQKITLFDEKQRVSYSLSPVMGDLTDQRRWRHVEDMGEIRVYENLRSMPRVWLVSEVLTAKAEEILQTIHSSLLPDGRSFNPSQVALVEEPFTFKAKEWDERATAKLVHLSNTHMEIQTNSLSPSFLVLSDVYYPGWKASVDGVETHLFQTNYALRGVLLPAGSHLVHLKFKPRSFYYGAGISAGSLLLLILILLHFQLKRRRLRKKKEVGEVG